MAALIGLGAAVAVTLSACAPGATTTNKNSGSISTNVDSKASTLTIMDEASTPNLLQEVAKSFMKAHPKIKVVFRSDTFANIQINAPRIMAGADAPDLMYLPTIGNTVKDGLVRNLDGYAKVYGWDKFPAGQLQGMRVEKNGTTKGGGSLYGMGVGYTLTGLYYNVALAKQAGITRAPQTVDELESDLEKAKSTGKVPLVSSGKDGGVAFPYQSLLQANDGSKGISDWIFDKSGATIKTDGAVKAAETIQEWAQKSYLSPDINAIDQTASETQFASGGGVFFASGNWQYSALHTAMGDNVAFIPFPGEKANSPVGLTDATEYVIPAKAKNPNAAAAFLNWINTSATGRKLTVTLLGLIPGGPATTSVKTNSALTDQIVKAFGSVGDADGFAPFLANATASIYSNTVTPQFQLLLGQKTTPSAFVDKLQSDYESQLGQ